MNSFKFGIIIVSLFLLSGFSAFACSAHAGADGNTSSQDGDKPVQG